VKLIRDDQNDRRTFGAFVDDDGVRVCDTLELPWRENQHSVSCIPAGEYPLAFKYSPKHGCECWHITNVPDRDDVEIHAGNAVR
jgi:hypothetical protein